MNGNIKCFNGGHIALGLLAILALGLCVAIIPLSFTYIMGWLRVKIAASHISAYISALTIFCSVHGF